jgi:hypothetical protein
VPRQFLPLLKRHLVLPHALFDPLVLSQPTNVCIALEAIGDVCAGSSCINVNILAAVAGGFVALLIIGVCIQLARVRNRAVAASALRNRGVDMAGRGGGLGAMQELRERLDW